MNRYIKTILIISLLLSYLIFTYALWWMSLLGTALIFLFARLFWSKNSVEKVGFKISKKEIIISLLIFVVVVLSAYWIINRITIENNILFIPFFHENLWYRNVFKTIGQTINEEIVLGALLLGYVRFIFKKVNPVVISIGVALIFCLFHFLFFYFRITSYTNFGTLSILCLFSIFFVGIIRNNCILSTGHIGYAWAIHFGWNLIFMDSSFYINNRLINEPNLFNYVLGNNIVAAGTLLLMLLSFGLYFIYKKTVI